ncbi:MAG: endonuclease/exonuclease/phosphatase family protein [Saprospiraceae bacterium]|nr:endonuclease/exonuclease/phosphatase family protein [Saprospiraceae bacterium]
MSQNTKPSIKIFILAVILLYPDISKTGNLPFRTSLKIVDILSEYETSLPVNRFNLISFNTWGLPVSLIGHDQTNRFERIPDSLYSSGVEIICLQETFHPVLRNKIIDKLRGDYYFEGNYRCNNNILGPIQKDCFGGLMTFSKYPIVSEQFYLYEIHHKTSLIEKIGAKGFLWTTINLNGKLINVINTHLYAGSDAQSEQNRKKQVVQMFSIIAEIKEFKLYPTFLLGDLNITHPDVYESDPKFGYPEVYNLLTGQMHFTDTKQKLELADLTYNGITNYHVKDSNNLQKLDYCLYHLPENETSLLLENQSVIFNKNQILSDHYGLKSQFIWVEQHKREIATSNGKSN